MDAPARIRYYKNATAAAWRFPFFSSDALRRPYAPQEA